MSTLGLHPRVDISTSRHILWHVTLAIMRHLYTVSCQQLIISATCISVQMHYNELTCIIVDFVTTRACVVPSVSMSLKEKHTYRVVLENMENIGSHQRY